MNAAEWLGSHSDGVPPALAGRTNAALTNASAQVASDDLVDAAEALLRGVLEAEPLTRAHALDLLAADALATYAFEAAADDPASLVARADDAMRRFAALAEAPR